MHSPYCRTLTCGMPVLFAFNLQTNLLQDTAWAPKCRNASHDADHAPFRDDLSSAGWDLLPLTNRPNVVSNYTHYEDMNSGAKWKNWGIYHASIASRGKIVSTDKNLLLDNSSNFCMNLAQPYVCLHWHNYHKMQFHTIHLCSVSLWN